MWSRRFWAFELIVILDAHLGPFLMDDVGEDGVSVALFDVVAGPVVGELVPGFLAGHALLDPLRAAALFLPGLAGAIEGTGRIGEFLHAFVADFCEPEFDGFGFGTGDALDEAEEGFGSGDGGLVILPVGCGHLQLVTICNQLAAFLFEPVFEDFPVVLGRLVVRLLGEDLDDVHDGEPPGFGFLVIDAANFVAFENGEVLVHVEGRLGWINLAGKEAETKCEVPESVHENAKKFSVGVNREVPEKHNTGGRAE